MSTSRGRPVTLIEPSLTSVILPSALMVTRGSKLASMRLRAYCESVPACCSACLRAVMSQLAIAETPTTAPTASQTRDVAIDTQMIRPSLHRRSAS